MHFYTILDSAVSGVDPLFLGGFQLSIYFLQCRIKEKLRKTKEKKSLKPI